MTLHASYPFVDGGFLNKCGKCHIHFISMDNRLMYPKKNRQLPAFRDRNRQFGDKEREPIEGVGHTRFP